MNTLEEDKFSLNHNYLLKLSDKPIFFEPISNLTNVFFDKDNQQLFCVRSNGVGGVIVKGPSMDTLTFRLEDKGNILSIRFSPNMAILGIIRQKNRIDFLNFKQSQPELNGEYSQLFKNKPSIWQDFYWINSNEILFVNELGFEHYLITPEKRSLKLLNNSTLQMNWLIWSRTLQLFVASTSTTGSILNPYVYHKTKFQKLPKFEVDLPFNLTRNYSLPSGTSNRYLLNENDVIINNVYNEFYVMVIRQMNSDTSRSYSEIAMYKLHPDNPAKKTYILRLNLAGRFVLSIVENLIIVHHQLTRSSLIYDIKMFGEFDGFLTRIDPIIKNAKLEVPQIQASLLSSIDNPFTDQSQVLIPEIYSKNWIMFLPNIIIDPKLGCYWFLELKLVSLAPLEELSNDPLKQIDFLLNRNNSKKLVLKICHDLIHSHSSLKKIEKIFEKINTFYKFINLKVNNLHLTTTSSSSSLTLTISGQNELIDIKSNLYPLIEQHDLYHEILYPLIEDESWWNTHSKYYLSVLIEYFRSLNSKSIPIEYHLYKLLFDTLKKSNKLYQLQQYLQYHVLTDSQPLACLLISIQSTYPAAYQLGLDMLKRLGTDKREIIDVLLSKKHVLSAIRYAQSNNLNEFLLPKKFFEATKELNDPLVFYSVFKYFEDKNIKERGTPKFKPEDDCDIFSKYFIDLFQNKI